MARALGPGVPVGGLAAGVAALVLWVSALSLGWLDTAVALLFVAGLALSLAGYAFGADERARRLGVIAVGWNAFGLAAFTILYAAG
ncbi:MAG: hypothetical protein JWN44_1897 [Myxococcales bacterium]|nr:hypothetical protein [Myxococcales bacterium]